MQLENNNKLSPEESDLPPMDFDEFDEVDGFEDEGIEDIEAKPVIKPHVLRRNIEDILEERALRRQLVDVFKEDLLD